MHTRWAMFAAVASLVAPEVAHADKVFQSGRGTTWDCKQDPVVTINHGDGTYTLKGSCKKVSLNGAHNTLTIESSEAVSINGSENTLTIRAVDRLDITGSDNKVTYHAAVHRDAPKVSDVGSDNVVSRNKSAGVPPAGADASAVPAGAIDCAKTSTITINEGDGNYKFVGTCTKIVINGGDNQAEIESVRTLLINGSDNTFAVGTADQISVAGSDNKISYRKGISGAKPKVSSIGQNNKITQLK